MKLEEMNLEQVTQRLAELDEEVRNANDVEFVNKATEEKKDLLARKAELEDLESRKQAALDISAQKVEPKVIETRKENEMEKTFAIDSVEYRNAWLNAMKNTQVSEAEQRALTGASYLVPTATANKVLDSLVDMVPLLNEIDLLRVKGNVTFAVNTVAPTVSIKEGGSAVDDGGTTFVQVSLGSYTISTIVRIGADTASMAIDAFEGWLIGKIAEQLSYKIEHYIINGDGEGEPTGIDLAFTSSAWTNETDAVDWASTSLGTGDIDKAIGLLPAAYDRNAKFLMSKKTFFQSVIGLEDVNNVPLVSREEGKYRIRGYEVIFSDQVTTGDIFYGDFKRGMVGNLSNEVQVERDRNLTYNAWDYLGWCSFDCKPSKIKAIIKIASDIA